MKRNPTNKKMSPYSEVVYLPNTDWTLAIRNILVPQVMEFTSSDELTSLNLISNSYQSIISLPIPEWWNGSIHNLPMTLNFQNQANVKKGIRRCALLLHGPKSHNSGTVSRFSATFVFNHTWPHGPYSCLLSPKRSTSVVPKFRQVITLKALLLAQRL